MRYWLFLELPPDCPDRLPTFSSAVLWLMIVFESLGILGGIAPVLLSGVALFASAIWLPIPTRRVVTQIVGFGTLLAVTISVGNLLIIRDAIALAIAIVLGTQARQFLLKIEWELASRKLLASLVNADVAETPDILIERTLISLRDLARADVAIALRQVDEVTAEALACLPQNALPDKITTPKLFAEALDRNCCLYYSDYASAPNAARLLLAKGTQSLAVLPLQDVGSLRGAILLIWYRRNEISSHLRTAIESILGGLRTLLRFSDTTFHLEKLQARYGAILETIPQGVVFVDESGEQGWLNRVAASQLGLMPGSVEPVSLSMAMARLRASADNREAIAQQAVEFFSKPMAEIRDWLWIFTSDQKKVLSISSTPTRVRDVPGRLWLLDDITERYFSRLALVDRTEQLEAVNQELEAFSHSVAHDLRGPLSIIDSFSLLLLAEYSEKLDEEGVDDLQSIRTAAVRMGQLIEDLLQFARVTRIEMKRELVDLSGLVEAISYSLQKRQPERQVDFAIEKGAIAKADARLVQIVLENLLSNAWKYTSKHPKARIEFGVLPHSLGQSPTHSLLPTYFVRDDGAGFDMAHADKLFQTFQRLHRSSEFEGTGVGLATVQRIIHRHGGRIWVDAAVEKGATFYFTL